MFQKFQPFLTETFDHTRWNISSSYSKIICLSKKSGKVCVCDHSITDNKENGMTSSVSGNFRQLFLKLKYQCKRKGVKNKCDHKRLVTQLISVVNRQSWGPNLQVSQIILSWQKWPLADPTRCIKKSLHLIIIAILKRNLT